jgi:hypothetical protein
MRTAALAVVVAACLCPLLLGLSPSRSAPDDKAKTDPPPDPYLGIPDGFDFPATEKALTALRDREDVAAMRRHSWMVFAGINQKAPSGGPLWETWYTVPKTFAAPRPKTPECGPGDDDGDEDGVLPFQPPRQFEKRKEIPKGVGQAILSVNLYSKEAYEHIRQNRFYSRAELDKINAAFGDAVKLKDRNLAEFPRRSVVLKTVWRLVRQKGYTPLPVWDFEPTNPPDKNNDSDTWKRVLAVAPPDEPAAEAVKVLFAKKEHLARVVPIKEFYNFKVGKKQLKSVQDALDDPTVKEGDSVILVAMHLTTKEMPEWVWATYWWHDRPDSGPYSADRPPPNKLSGVWRHFLMNTTYSMETPREFNGEPHACYNPWLETAFSDGMSSNCMSCHRLATYPETEFIPVPRGKVPPDQATFKGKVKTDFLFSISDRAK